MGNTIALALEKTAEEQVVLVVGGLAKTELSVFDFTEQVVDGAFFVSNEFVEVYYCLINFG